MNPQPKPTKRPAKPRKPLRRSWMRKSKRGTSHSRRVREWGRMAFYKTLSCDVPKAYADTFGEDWWDIDGGIPETDECTGPVQVMHLREHASQKRAPDYRTAPGCKHHHQDIDGKVGGRGPWYVALGREGQRALRDRLVARANLRWLMLTGNQRADWDARSRLQPATKTKGPNHA